MKKLIATTAAVAVLAATAGIPTQAEARTKDIVKYGAIGLGAVALSQALQPSYGYNYYPSSSYYYNYPSYGYSSYSYPSYGYSYGYSYPSYGYSYGYPSGYYSYGYY